MTTHQLSEDREIWQIGDELDDALDPPPLPEVDKKKIGRLVEQEIYSAVIDYVHDGDLSLSEYDEDGNTLTNDLTIHFMAADPMMEDAQKRVPLLDALRENLSGYWEGDWVNDDPTDEQLLAIAAGETDVRPVVRLLQALLKVYLDHKKSLEEK